MLGAGDLRAEVGKVKDSLAALCSGLDPDSIPLPEVTSVWEAFDAMERLAAGAKCRLARRVEESRSWATQGARSPAEHLAQRSGTTTGRARAALEASKRLAALPTPTRRWPTASCPTSRPKPSPGPPAPIPAPRRGCWHWPVAVTYAACARSAPGSRPGPRTTPSGPSASIASAPFAPGPGPTGRGTSWPSTPPRWGAQVEAALATLREAVFQSARLAGHHESGEAYGADHSFRCEFGLTPSQGLLVGSAAETDALSIGACA